MSIRYVPISSIELDHLKDARVHPRASNQNEKMWVTLLVRSRCPDEERLEAVAQLSTQLPRQRRRYSSREFARRFGSSPAAIRKVTTFARRNGLRVLEASAKSSCVRLAGNVRRFSRAFDVKIVNFVCPTHGLYRSHLGPIQIPVDLEGWIDGVLGFDVRPLNASPYSAPARSLVDTVRFKLPADVARYYRFPADASGKGQCIGIIELGGGFLAGDVKEFFARLGLPTPKITVVELDGQTNAPASKAAIRKAWESSHILEMRVPPECVVRKDYENSPQNVMWTVEATMDVELAGALANAARLVVYFAPNTAQGKFDAYRAAIFDAENRPSVISCSWGAHESSLAPLYLRQMDRLFQLAALRGVTIVHSAGDDGDGSGTGDPTVHFPASSPHVLAVGGSEFQPWEDAKREEYWDEREGNSHFQGGHGISAIFKTPHWQPSAAILKQTGRQGRAVPDVSGKADLRTAYQCWSADMVFPGFGTSAAAPMWAALVARLNEKLGVPAGFLTPLLYSRRFDAATKPVPANGSKKMGNSRWDKRTGVGSPDGMHLLEALETKRR